ncbi:MAG: phosphodiester glycosidase family protein [Oscillospiraceae bacterium]|nr:phosphodiester glycosidase family protein [Oscillospiraceae bacterium]
MKNRMLKFSLALIIILSLMLSVISVAFALGDVVYTDTRMLADNLELRNSISWHGTHGRTEHFALTMTGAGDARPIIMKGDTVFGTTRISSMVDIAQNRGFNVLAAVNADFFFPAHGGVPMGIVIEDGVYLSSPGGRNAVVFGDDGRVDVVSSPTVWKSLFNMGGNTQVNNEGQSVSLSQFNKPRTDLGGMVLYSEVFSTVSTRTASPGWYVRFRILEGVPSVSGTMMLEVVEASVSETAPAIGAGYLILTAAEASNLQHEFEKFAVGDRVRLTTSVTDSRLANARYATGGGYILVADGVRADPANWSNALRNRAPRTAIGVRADGSIIVMVVDGRNAEHSVGVTLDELTDEMLRQGAVFAVNFDGGGSSAMSVRVPGEGNATTISRPSDGSERGCATYLLFVTDATPGGPARNLGLRNNGVIVLAGSSVDLSLVATDAGYMPAGVPGDVQVTTQASDAHIDGLRFTAGSVAGADRLRLFSPSTGALGYGEVFVLNSPTSISVRRAGTTTPLTSVTASPGDILEFDVVASFYRRAVISQIHAFDFTVSGDIGEMIAPGVFQVAETIAQNGIIMVSAGNRSVNIAVEISGFADMTNHWARAYAEFLASAGITMGISPTEYGPEREMLRGDFILMLYRAAGAPAVDGSSGFHDVPEDAYFAQAMAWAESVGVVGGAGTGLFEPLAPLSRASAFTFTYRALSVIGIDVQSGTYEDLMPFPDADQVADFAVVPTATLIRLGIVEGSNGQLIPDSTLTRAQMAKVLSMVLQLS